MNTTISRCAPVQFRAQSVQSAAVAASVQAPRFGASSDEGVTVHGTATVLRDPDTMTMRFTTQEKASQYNAVMRNLNQQAENLLDKIQALNIPNMDVKTQFQVRPNTEWSHQLQKHATNGYVGSFTVTATHTKGDHTKFPEYASQLTRVAAETEATCQEPEYDYSNKSEAMLAALTLAIEDAKTKAAAVAKAMGFKINETTPFSVEIGASHSSQRHMARAESAMASDAGGGMSAETFQFGQVPISAPPVMVRFKIQ